MATMAIKKVPMAVLDRIVTCRNYIKRFGVEPGLRAFLQLRLGKGDDGLRIPGLQMPLHFRRRSGDLPLFDHIFVDQEYALDAEIRPRYIVDAGANVGYASLFFANRYPEARILAIECEDSNFRMLQNNTRDYRNVDCVKAALWHEKTELTIANPDAEKYAYRVEEARAANGAQKVATITMEEILRRADNNFIDLLKIDIEGAEREVFSGGAEWLQHVGLIIIELHDRFKPGCAKAFYDAIAHFDFVQSQKGENLFVWLSGRAPGATGQTVSAAYP